MALPGNLTPPRGSRDDLRPKSRACGPVGLRNAPAGAVQASSPTEVCCNGGPRFPGWPRHSPSSVGADSISARRRLRRRGVRRDEGIPPYGRLGGHSRSGLAGHFGRFVGAGFIPPGALRRRRVRGTMQASSPTEVCGAAGARFPGWPRHSPSSVGADSISARGRLRRRGVRRDEGIPPYGRPGGYSRSGLAGCVRKACRGGIYPSRKPCRSHHTHGRAAALLYEPVQIPPSGWPQTQNLFVGAGFIPPAGVCAAAGVRDDASIVPYRGLRHGKVAVSWLGTGLPSIVGAGFIPPAGVCAAAGVRRDEGIPPYERPGGYTRSGLAGHFGRFVGAGFIPPGALRRRRVRGTMQASSPTGVCGTARLPFPGWPRHSPSSVGADSISARRRLRRRGVRRDEDIPPYGRPGGYSRSGLV